MIYVTGDTHSDFERFTARNFPAQSGMTKEDFVIIAGDFGGVWYPAGDAERRRAEDANLDALNDRPFTTLFVPGNHENYARLMSDEFEELAWHGGRVKRIRPSVLMLMRGELFDLCGAKVFAFGGARSHDIQDGLLDAADPDWLHKARRMQLQGKWYFRVKGLSWWAEELPNGGELVRGLDVLDACGWRVDYVITHCAPTGLQQQLGRGGGDLLTDYLEQIHVRLSYERWFFGHYHADCTLNARDALMYHEIVRVR